MATPLTTTPIVALDFPIADDALALVDTLGERCRFYKVGNQLFTAAGPALVRALRARECDVFLDLKFHDIPNTVAGGVRNAVTLGARLVTVHATGGRAMLEAAVRAADGECGVLVVTVLTSMSESDLAAAWGRPELGLSLPAEVIRLAEMAAGAGAHGVVCSGREAALIRDRFGDRLASLVPGVRASGGSVHDQARVVTPAEAVAAGARYIVVGRMVTAAEDPAVAMDAVLAQVSTIGSEAS